MHTGASEPEKNIERPVKVIACATVAEELLHLGIADEDLLVLEFGLHADPEKLRCELQERIDGTGGDVDLLLGYGLCSYAVVGLPAGAHRLIIPKVQDCISIFLGSEEERLRILSCEPGTYFLTKGWVEAADSAYTEFLRLRERYGEQRAIQVAKLLLANYTRVALINTGNYRMDEYRAFAREMAELLGLAFEEIPGSNALLKKMLERRWDSQFVVVPPGEAVKLSDF